MGKLQMGKVRAKLRRVTDGAALNGWVVGEREPNFLVSAVTTMNVAVGDPFVCEFHALEWTITSLVVARFVNVTTSEGGAQEVNVALEQVRTVSVSRGSGNERVLANGLTATLWGKSGPTAKGCDVLDISRRGLAVHVPEAMDPGTQVTAVVEGADEPLTFTCEIRYSRPHKTGFRIGLEIMDSSRVTQAKWAQTVVEGKSADRAAA